MAHYPNRRRVQLQKQEMTAVEFRPEPIRTASLQTQQALLFSEMLTDERARMRDAQLEEPERWDGMS